MTITDVRYPIRRIGGHAERLEVIGAIVEDGELIEVTGRAEDPGVLWLQRVHPRPLLDVGSVRWPSGDAAYIASAHTLSWLRDRREAVTSLAVALYLNWIALGCPCMASLVDQPAECLAHLMELSSPPLCPAPRASARTPTWVPARLTCVPRIEAV